MNRIYRRRGFTIVELLIVIVVIAILAAITIVAFNGIRQRSVEASMQTDLRNAGSQLMNDNTTAGSYPANAAAADSGRGLKSSGDNTYTYHRQPFGFCLLITNPGTTTTYRVKNNDNKVVAGNCDAVATTYAGSSAGYNNATGTAAQFSAPTDIALSPSGDYYIADAANNRIRKMTAAAVVTTFAGSGAAGNADGTGTAATFQNISGITADASGNLYVTSNTACIRKITPAAVVSTLNTCTYSWLDGTLPNANFRNPDGIEVDKQGNIYIADRGNHRIRMISTANVVSTIAGSGTSGSANGTGTGAQFSFPSDIAIDAAGYVYVVDSNNNRIRRIAPGGLVDTFAGSTAGYADGTGAAAQFSSLDGITIDDAGNLYVTEGYGSNRIRKITPGGVVTTLAGSGSAGYTDSTGTSAQFDGPAGLDIDLSGRLILTEELNNRIRILTL